MGLVNSPAVCQRTANVMLEGRVGQMCHIYVDDIVIYSPDFETHLVFIEPVLYRLLGAGLKLKSLKCPFLKREVTYPGHVSAIGVKSDPKNVKRRSLTSTG